MRHASISTLVPMIFVWRKMPGSSIERSTCDSAAKLSTMSGCSSSNSLSTTDMMTTTIQASHLIAKLRHPCTKFFHDNFNATLTRKTLLSKHYNIHNFSPLENNIKNLPVSTIKLFKEVNYSSSYGSITLILSCLIRHQMSLVES